MSRELSVERQRELDALRALLLALIDFHQLDAGKPSDQGFGGVVEREYRKRSLTGLRQMRNDLVAMTEAVTARAPEARRSLDAILRERAGVSLDAIFARQLTRITKLRERGRITTDEQYNLVKERVEFIWDDPARDEEFTALQDMLTAYEEKVARRSDRKRRSSDPAV